NGLGERPGMTSVREVREHGRLRRNSEDRSVVSHDFSSSLVASAFLCFDEHHRSSTQPDPPRFALAMTIYVLATEALRIGRAARETGSRGRKNRGLGEPYPRSGGVRVSSVHVMRTRSNGALRGRLFALTALALGLSLTLAGCGAGGTPPKRPNQGS